MSTPEKIHDVTEDLNRLAHTMATRLLHDAETLNNAMTLMVEGKNAEAGKMIFECIEGMVQTSKELLHDDEAPE